jgi:hypothetical protein
MRHIANAIGATQVRKTKGSTCLWYIFQWVYFFSHNYHKWLLQGLVALYHESHKKKFTEDNTWHQVAMAYMIFSYI